MRNNTSNSSKYYSNEWNHFFKTIVPNTLRLSFTTERLALQTYAIQNSKHYTTILSVTTPLSRSTGAQERAPRLLPFWSFTSFSLWRSRKIAITRQDQRPPSQNLLATRQCLQFHQPGFKTFQTWQKFKHQLHLPVASEGFEHGQAVNQSLDAKSNRKLEFDLTLLSRHQLKHALLQLIFFSGGPI